VSSLRDKAYHHTFFRVALIRKLLIPVSFFPRSSPISNLRPVIIVNASKYSCDALVVFLDRDPIHIPLQITQENVRDLSTELHTLTVRAKRVDVTRALASFLRKPWDQIVSPIVNRLQMTHPSHSLPSSLCYPRCLALMYPRSLYRFGLLVLAVCNYYQTCYPLFRITSSRVYSAPHARRQKPSVCTRAR
jgi:hypothetical protein